MKSRPILFSAPMVRALLGGRKTQTRRALRLAPHHATAASIIPAPGADAGVFDGLNADGSICFHSLLCPYGKPGDTLWVREEHYVRGHWEPVDGVRTRTGRMKWRFVAADDVVRFEAPTEGFRKGRHHKDPGTVAWHKRLARFMPRRLSRITLEVTGVRVERLNSISEADAKAEGAAWRIAPGGDLAGAFEGLTGEDVTIGYCAHFRSLWESINGADSWDANPWVWVVEFPKVVTP